MRKILFVCVENAGRSQMAEAFARRFGADAMSAGAVPSSSVNPMVAEAMGERGISLFDYKPKMLTDKMVEEADYVVTMGCSVESVCPKPLVLAKGKKLIEWHIEDPKGKPIEEVRRIRSDIERKVFGLLKEID